MQEIFVLLLEWLKKRFYVSFCNCKSYSHFALLSSENSTVNLCPQSSEFYKVTTEQYQKAAEEVEAKFK